MKSVPMKRSLDSIRSNVNMYRRIALDRGYTFSRESNQQRIGCSFGFLFFSKKMRLSSPSAVTDFYLCSYLAILVVILTSFKYLFGFCSL